MKAHLKVLTMAALLIFACLPASATTITGSYANEASFTAASGPITTVTFDGLVAFFSTAFPDTKCLPNASFTDCSVNVEGFIGSSQLPNVFYLTEGNGDPIYNWGNGDVPGTGLAQGASNNGHTLICLAADPSCVKAGTASSTAFSFELMTILPDSGTVDVLVRTENGTTRDFTVPTGSQPNRTFFGVTTDGDIISSVTLTTSGGGNDYLLFDNVQYQFNPEQPKNPIPEPASLVLFGSGILAASSALRRRVKR